MMARYFINSLSFNPCGLDGAWINAPTPSRSISLPINFGGKKSYSITEAVMF